MAYINCFEAYRTVKCTIATVIVGLRIVQFNDKMFQSLIAVMF